MLLWCFFLFLSFSFLYYLIFISCIFSSTRKISFQRHLKHLNDDIWAEIENTPNHLDDGISDLIRRMINSSYKLLILNKFYRKKNPTQNLSLTIS